MDATLKYAWTSSVNAASFLTVKPSLADSESRSNFESWKVQMLCLLQSQDLMGFVDGETVPVEGDEEDCRMWTRSDSLVKGWILGSVERDVLSAVRGKPTAREIWLELDNIFNQQPQVQDQQQLAQPEQGQDQQQEAQPEQGQEPQVQEQQQLAQPEQGQQPQVQDQQRLAQPEQGQQPQVQDQQQLAQLEQGQQPPQEEEEQGYVQEEEEQGQGYVQEKEEEEQGQGYAQEEEEEKQGQGYVQEEEEEEEEEEQGQGQGYVQEEEEEEEEEEQGQGYVQEEEEEEQRQGYVQEEEIRGRLGRGGLRNRLSMSAGVDLSRYLPLYQAALKGDWDFARNFFPDINQLCTTRITKNSETVLHIAVLAGESNRHFVNQLVRMTPPEQLALQDAAGSTALRNAALVGNIAAATELVFKNRELLRIPDFNDLLPVNVAGGACHKETLKYLISEHEANGEHDPLFRSHEGVHLLNDIITSEFVDIALDLAQRYPHLATLRKNPQPAVPQSGEEVDYSSTLSSISETPALFPRAETFTWWKWFIYHCIPNKKLQHEVVRNGDIENLTTDGAAQNSSTSLLRQKLENFIPFVIENLVPTGKEMTKKKATRQQALQLTEFLCKKIASELPHEEAYNIFKKSMLTAIECGISEIVENIIHEFPVILYQRDNTGKNIMQMAATYRYENVFNLVYNLSGRKYALYHDWDKENDTLLHTCGRLAPPSMLNLVAGAALQMQRELQWFKEMEKFVDHSRRTWLNKAGKTPQMVFTEAHNKLKEDGEKWMKDTATACSISATLIATVVFAAALTVPGGLGSGAPSGVPFGVPFFTGQSAFEVFAVADTISLFASITSLLMFLSILTARYAEEDFLYDLPNRLCMGLLSLFVSITSMLVAFGATLYLLLRRDMAFFWVLLSIFVCLPIASLVLLQLPLFVHVFYSTHGPGIFGKKGNKIL